MRKRLIRIVPLYWLATLCTLVVLVLGSGGACGTGGPLYILASFLFLPALSCEGEYQPVLTQGWTLNYEMVFYVAFSAALLAGRRLGLTLLCLALSLPMLVFQAWAATRPQGVGGFGVLAFFLDTITIFFVIGIGAGLVYRHWPKFIPQAASLLPMLAVPLVCNALLGRIAGSALEMGVLTGAVSVGVFALCLCASSGFSDGGATALFLCIGDASYSIYLFHILALTLLRKTFGLFLGPAHPFLFIASGLVFCALVGIALRAVVERPIDRVLRGQLRLREAIP